jgi:hypothetical protein
VERQAFQRERSFVETNFVQTPRTGSNVTQILPTEKERIAGIRTGCQLKGSCHCHEMNTVHLIITDDLTVMKLTAFAHFGNQRLPILAI